MAMTVVDFYEGSLVVMGAARQSRAASPVNDSKRGRVSSFSRRSRTRLMRLTASIRRRSLASALFVTLTYPARWSADPARWKRDIDTFGKALRRAYPEASAVWRIEAQERGAPHYHLLVFGVSFIPYEWVAETWARVCEFSDADHLAAGTEVRACESGRKAVHYMSKYVAKVADEDHAEFRAGPLGPVVECPGRAWGIINRGYLPVSPVRVYSVPRRSVPEFRELIGRRFGDWVAEVPLTQSRCFFWHGRRPEYARAGALPALRRPPARPGAPWRIDPHTSKSTSCGSLLATLNMLGVHLVIDGSPDGWTPEQGRTEPLWQE